jgi:DNA/RNA endonuclease G (NUC1)
LAQSDREAYIIAGGAGSAGDVKGITVPEGTWKVIVALERGKSYPEGQEKAQVFAILMPNHDGIMHDRWQDHQVSVSEIEKKTGYHFFKNAPVIASVAKNAGRF